jgi:hypothetical protein
MAVLTYYLMLIMLTLEFLGCMVVGSKRQYQRPQMAVRAFVALLLGVCLALWGAHR